MRRGIEKTGWNMLASLVGSHRRPSSQQPGSFLVIRRNRMGDMICTVPMLHALRGAFPRAKITVACGHEGAPIARACPAVNEVYVLKRGFQLYANIRNARRLQGHDAVLAIKVGFDQRLASLTRMTQAPVRIGYEKLAPKHTSFYYTHPLPYPLTPEHQIESCLRLLRPLGIEKPVIDLTLQLPESATDYAVRELQQRHFHDHAFFAVINISSTQPSKWPMRNFKRLAERLANEEGALVGLVSTPADRKHAAHIVHEIGSRSVFAAETPSVLEAAALLRHAAFVFTPEGGVGHLAAAFERPALIFWSGGPFSKWNTRAPHHRNIRADLSKKPISVDDVWEILAEDYLQHARSVTS